MLFLAALCLPFTAAIVSAAPSTDGLEARATDPCTVIAGQTWVAPSDVRACFNSFPVNATIKQNVGNALP